MDTTSQTKRSTAATIFNTALAFVGLTLGAGFASGQEVVAYFVGYGWGGIVGTIVSGFMLAMSAMMTMQLGSLYKAKEHSAVFRAITHGAVARIIDVFIIFTLFCVGFVMVAGAGSSLHQQFGLSAWVGAAALCILVFVTCIADVDRVISVMGMMTPVMAVAVVMASVYALFHMDGSWSYVEAQSHLLLHPTMPNWWISTINYVSLSVALGVSMTLVMGGSERNPRVAGRGGFLGGVMYGTLLLLSALALMAKIPSVSGKPMPMLHVMTLIHPWMGAVMAVIIYFMIFNTALGMYYALARRLSKYSVGRGKSEIQEKKRSLLILAVLLLSGFVLSFFGFSALVAYLYPVMGYMGIAVIVIIAVAWVRQRRLIAQEALARRIADEGGEVNPKR